MSFHTNRLARCKRLDKPGVVGALKSGKRLQTRSFEAWVSSALETRQPCGARVAIAVSKRLLPSSVARNRIKRLVREAFRTHAATRKHLDLLVKYRLHVDGSSAANRLQLRVDLNRLLDKAIALEQRA